MRFSSFVIHYSPLSDRRDFIDTSGMRQALKPCFITENAVPKGLASYIYSDQISDLKRTRIEVMSDVATIYHILVHHLSCINQRVAVEPVDKSSVHRIEGLLRLFFNQALQVHSGKNIELGLQHLEALKKGLGEKAEWILILEDDAIPLIKIDFLGKRIDELCKRHSCDIPTFIDIGSALGLIVNHKNQKNLSQEMGYGQTRCCSSYLVNKKAAYEILKHSRRTRLPIDWHLSVVLCDAEITTVWAQDPIFGQGSEMKNYISNATVRNCSS